MATTTAAAPLLALLDQIQSRLAQLEARAGVASPAAHTSAHTGAGALPAPAAGASAAAAATAASPALASFDELVAKYGQGTLEAAKAIGGNGIVLGEVYLGLWQWLRKLVDASAKCKRPDDAAMKSYMAEANELGKRLGDLTKPDSELVDHGKAAIEGVSAFFLFSLPGTLPTAAVTNGLEQFEFWAMRARKASKDKNKPEWMTWANVVRDGFKGLSAWIVANELKAGLSWNGQGGDFSAYVKGASAAAPAPAAAAPAAAATAAAPAAAAAGAPKPATPGASLQSQLFKQISSIDQSSGRTEGLRHVTKDMKSSAQKDAPAPVVKAAAAAAPRKTADEPLPTGTPAVELVDRRWQIEYHTSGEIRLPGNTGKALEAAHEVYIYACRDCVVYIDNKCKGVRMDKCRNVTLLVDSLLAGIEVVNAKKIKMQVKKSVPSVAIDKCDGVVVGLSYTSRGAQIVTSKSSEMNVTFPVSEAEDADWLEMPIPEQFVSKITADNKVITTVSELYTA